MYRIEILFSKFAIWKDFGTAKSAYDFYHEARLECPNLKVVIFDISSTQLTLEELRALYP